MPMAEKMENMVNEKWSYMSRRIGSTTYRVKVIFNDTARETLEEKIIRLIRYEALENGEKCDTMSLPQMSRQSERSA